jgi:ribosomal protein L40E
MAGSLAANGERGPSADPLGPNAACYVCHMAFVREELSKTHLAAKVTCIRCHGLSAKHANDEDIGATKPDRVFAREQVNRMCRRCHSTHDVPPEAVIARWLEQRLTESPVCTDCHGAHRLDHASTP